MEFTVRLNCNNAAFGDNPTFEIARILKKITNSLEWFETMPDSKQRVQDSNGNTVGYYVITKR